ncbi:dynamin family protein [Paraburkholderia sp. C35]|uniref:dynamin family protein n=1 Tax=Paraburkholderia sp. C35 TaxID=2126993 RepID=UPI000D68607B|nr:dynamin family protein [Paraburkholderia sp. C35]
MSNERRCDFPDDYAGYLLSTFQRIDELLGRCVHLLDPTMLASPFSPHIADVTTSRHLVVADHYQRVRDAMALLLERHAIAAPDPAISVVRSARALIDEALVAVTRLNPSANPTLAAMDAQQQEDTCRIVDELIDALAVMSEDLRTDVTEPEPHASAHAIRLSSADLRLSTMRRATLHHGLARLAGCVDALAARVASGHLTIGVFGDVSSGKSSLVNCMLGTPLLPVAGVPTTVVPVYLDYAQQESGFVEFADAVAEHFERGRLAEFADEHANAHNRRHVTRIRFGVPSALLKRGITVVDTPGVSHHAGVTSLPDPALTYRCDLAVVLVSAVGPLTLTEAELIDELRHTGMDIMVLVTKADLLAPEDRWSIFGHIVKDLWQKAHFEVPVYLISTRNTEVALCKAWLDGPLSDYILESEGRHAGMLAARAERLREQVVESLEQRAAARGARVSVHRADLTGLRASLEAVHSQLATAKQQSGEYPHDPDVRSIVDEVAHNAAVLWAEDRDDDLDVTRILELAVIAHASNLSIRASWRVEQLRAEAAMVLVTAANTLQVPGSGFGYLPPLHAPPAPHPVRATLAVTIPNQLSTFIGRWGFYLDARRYLRRSPAISAARQLLNDHLAAVQTWKGSSLSVLSDAFDAQYAQLKRYLEPLDTQKGDSFGDARTAELLADLSMLHEPEASGAADTAP